jgi:hypothetical protein
MGAEGDDLAALHVLDDPSVRGQRPAVAADLAVHQSVGTAVDGVDHHAVTAGGDGVGTEQDAARVGVDEGLDQHGHVGRVGHVAGGDPSTDCVARGNDGVDGGQEATPVAHVEHRGELAGHGADDAVLAGGGGADDHRSASVLGHEVPTVAHGVLVTGAHAGCRQHDAGQDG